MNTVRNVSSSWFGDDVGQRLEGARVEGSSAPTYALQFNECEACGAGGTLATSCLSPSWLFECIHSVAGGRLQTLSFVVQVWKYIYNHPHS